MNVGEFAHAGDKKRVFISRVGLPAALALGCVLLTQVHLRYLFHARDEFVFFQLQILLEFQFFLFGRTFGLAGDGHEFDSEFDSAYF